MSTRHENPKDEIGELLADAGPPPELPQAELTAIRSAARKQWQELSATPIFEGRDGPAPVHESSATPIFEGRRRLRPLLALAASLLIAVISIFVYKTLETPDIVGPVVAFVELIEGEVRSDAGDGVRVSGISQIEAGTRIDTLGSPTQPARIALRMTSGHSVRIDQDSSVVFGPNRQLRLLRGAVYVDSGPQGGRASLEVQTPLGAVSEVGTQYEVRLEAGATETVRVRVREGRISLWTNGESVAAERGEELRLSADGTIERQEVPTHGPHWAWVVNAAPSFDFEEQTLESFLEWASRETGLEIEFGDPSMAYSAAIGGSIHAPLAGFTPQEALETILRASDLDFQIEGGRLLIVAPEG